MSALSLTCNTLESTSSTPPEDITGNWGIDTVVLAYDIVPESVDVENSMWRRKTAIAVGADMPDNGEFIADVPVGESKARVRLHLYPGQVTWEFEAGQLAGFPRPRLLPPDALRHLVRHIADQFMHVFMPCFIHIDTETGEITHSSDWAEQIRIRRLDVTRDFAVPRHLQEAFKTALDGLTPRYSRGVGLRYNNSNGGWTYYNPSETQGCERIYNKDAQMRIGGDDGYVRDRFEVELRKDRLDRLGLTTLDAVTADTVWAALKNRFEALRLDEPLANSSLVMERLAQLELSEQIEAMAYLGFRTFSAQKKMPRRKQTAARKALIRVGLNPRRGLLEQPATTMRLCLEEGVLREDAE